MKKIATVFAAIVFFVSHSFSQTAKVTWGDDMKIKKGTVELNIIHADKTGVYVQEGQIRMKSYFVIGATYGEAIKFRKLGNDYEEIFSKDYRKELKGKDFNRIIPFKNGLFLFADDYDKKTKTFITYVAKIDKGTGALISDWKEVASVEKEDRKDDYDFNVVPTADSAKMVLVADISNNDKTALDVMIMDENLNISSRTSINLSYEAKTYQLQDVIYTIDNKILVVGKVFEMEDYGKKKKQRLAFKNYSIERYDLRGKKEMDLPTSFGDKILLSGKLVATAAGQLFITGFYTNDAKSKEVNGIYVNRIDPVNGTVIQSSIKEINQGLIGEALDDKDDDADNDIKNQKEASKKARDNDEMDGFSSNYIFRNVYINPDNSLLLLAEKHRFDNYSYITSSYDNMTKMWRHETVTVYEYTDADIMAIKVGADGNIAWLNVIPKFQVENLRSSRNSTSLTGISFNTNGADPTGFFATAGGMPFYTSFSSVLVKNKLFFFFNDNPKNGNVTKAGDKVKKLYRFDKSECYSVTLDLNNGAVKKQLLFSNDDEPAAALRHGKLIGNELYISGIRFRVLAKTKVRFGKIIIK